MKKEITSPEKIGISKEKVLAEKVTNRKEAEALQQVAKMSNEEIKQLAFKALYSDDLMIGLSKSGHSKGILKVDKIAEGLFDFQWVLLNTPKGTSFITSDNPCFTISLSKIMNGMYSPKSRTIFPLRPDLCVYINPSIKSNEERYLKLDKKQVRDINLEILRNSYKCVVAKDEVHLKKLTEGFDYKNHRKSRQVAIYEKGDYVMFNIE